MKESDIMSKRVNDLLENYVVEIKKIYGIYLKQIILYGSYARGDYNENSDVDIMILVDLPDEKIKDYSDALSEIDFEFYMEYDLRIMPIVNTIERFEYWCQAYPFYFNVKKEGLLLYKN